MVSKDIEKLQEVINLAKQVPENVVKAFYEIRKDYPLKCLFNIAQSDDGAILGDLCMKLYDVDDSVVDYLVTDDGGLIDGAKLELSIIALDIAYKEGKYNE